jgi:hypothetical protein
MKKVTQILVIIIILLNCCLSFAGEIEDKNAYIRWLSTCKDYKDVGDWLAKNFIYDKEKIKHSLANKIPTEIYMPWTTFKKKGGVCSDAAYFVKYSLNKINPDYKADAIYLFTGKRVGKIRPGDLGHFVCGFFLKDKLYVMDYGAPKSNKQFGTWGPFNDLDEYVNKCYLVVSKGKKLAGWHFGRRTAEETEIEFSNTSNKNFQFNKVTGKYEMIGFSIKGTSD